jgi:hypothetical protein
MSANILPENRDQSVDVAYESPKRLEWVVRENQKLQEELNKQYSNGKKVSPRVVNKVMDRIKDL